MGVEQGVDFFALSFVRSSRDVLRLRHLLDEKDAKQPIVAKIEKPEGWVNLDSILEECEGVMVARGDLGVEMAPEKVPAIQKSIIERARKCGKFVITATQMLESMIHSPLPTRAEVSDVANAIYDGTSAVMLSAETSAGKYPVDSVQVMARIAGETEAAIHKKGFADVWSAEDQSIPEIIADAAYHSARCAGVVALAVGTTSGASARLLARYRPPVPIYAFTSSEAVAQQLTVVYGVNADCFARAAVYRRDAAFNGARACGYGARTTGRQHRVRRRTAGWLARLDKYVEAASRLRHSVLTCTMRF